jgi:hypothetical protein
MFLFKLEVRTFHLIKKNKDENKSFFEEMMMASVF